MAHKKQTYYIVGKMEKTRIATFLLQQDVIWNLMFY